MPKLTVFEVKYAQIDRFFEVKLTVLMTFLDDFDIFQ